MLLLLTITNIFEVSKLLYFILASAGYQPLSQYWTFLPPSLRQQYFVSTCFLLRRQHIRSSETHHSCRNSAVLRDRILNSSVPDFHRCVPHGFVVVASSSVIVSFFCLLRFMISDCIYDYDYQQFVRKLLLKVLCVVLSDLAVLLLS